jgi:hypothetical protein
MILLYNDATSDDSYDNVTNILTIAALILYEEQDNARDMMCSAVT